MSQQHLKPCKFCTVCILGLTHLHPANPWPCRKLFLYPPKHPTYTAKGVSTQHTHVYNAEPDGDTVSLTWLQTLPSRMRRLLHLPSKPLVHSVVWSWSQSPLLFHFRIYSSNWPVPPQLSKNTNKDMCLWDRNPRTAKISRLVLMSFIHKIKEINPDFHCTAHINVFI